MLGHLILECVGKFFCGVKYNVFGCDGDIGEVSVFVENHARYSCCTCRLDPQVPALIVLGGCAEPIVFDTVFGKGFVSVGLFVDEGFHADGDEWHSIVVMGAIEVGIYGDCSI